MAGAEKEKSSVVMNNAHINTTLNEENICRLCLNTTDSKQTIFDDENSLTHLINELFQINYEKLALLPSHICERCLFMIKSFKQFKEIVTQCEIELQKYLKSFLETKEKCGTSDKIPGLNGNPGIFEPDENCIISEIDPNQDFESSEDEFSMESDTDAELDIEMQSKSNMYANVDNDAALVEKNIPQSTAQVDISMITQTRDIASSNEYQNKNTYLCQYCDMAFTTPSECADHEKRHDVANPYTCAFCAMRSSNRQNLIYHIREAHDAERPFICALCNKGFCRRSDLKKHTIVHTGVRPFTCPSCSKSFSRNTNLTKHMRIHSSERPHVCQLCPRSFTTANELHLHTRTHAEVKPYRCTRCPSSFTRRDKLVLHERTHTRRDSELQMSQVGATNTIGGGLVSETLHSQFPTSNETDNVTISSHFSASAGHSEHLEHETYANSILATQLQQRPLQQANNVASAVPTQVPIARYGHVRTFKCEICAITFNRERDLQRHQALHLDTLFTCKQCGMVFNRREKLMRHENEMHAPQYPCNICHIIFNKREDLEVHKKVHEIQQTVAMNAQAAVNAAAGSYRIPNTVNKIMPPMPSQRPTAADLSFYSNLVPTMNLGFYSETKPDERNDQ